MKNRFVSAIKYILLAGFLLNMPFSGCRRIGLGESPSVTAQPGVLESPTDFISETPDALPSPSAPPSAPPALKASELPKDEERLVAVSLEFEFALPLMASGEKVHVRDEPSAETGQVVTVVTLGQKMLASAVQNGWYKVTVLPGMQQGYIRSDFAEDYDAGRFFYAQLPKETFSGTAKDGSSLTLTNNLVDVRQYAPDIVYHLVFATPDNYVGRTLYARDVCLLQKGTAEKLAKAEELFMADGYRIKVYDAYRPSSVSGILYETFPDSTYVSPAGWSNHNKGASVDITLVDEKGNELEMPSAVMELNEKAGRNQPDMSPAAKANMDYLTGVMRECGFMTYGEEWWHYTDTNVARFPVSDIDFAQITFAEQPSDF